MNQREVRALTLWDSVIEVFHSVPNRSDGPRESHGEARRQLLSQTCITPSQSSTPTSFQQTLITFHQIQRIAMLYVFAVFEDKEAVIKMIIKGQIPTKKHF